MKSDNPTPEPGNPAPTKTFSTWFGLATRELTPGRSVRIRIRWGRVMGLCAALALLFWAGKSAGLYFFFREFRDFEDVSITDMVLFPLNRANVRVQQGNYQIDQARGALEREDYRRAYALLREGVVRAPANLEGRMLLAQIYAGWRPDLATDLLLDGVTYGKEDSEYVRLMSLLLLSQKEDARILELTGTLLEEDLPKEIQQVLAVSRLQAAMLTGQFAIVRGLFEETDLEQTMDGVLLGSQLYVRTGQPEMAAQILQSVINTFPEGQLDPIYNQLVSVYKKQELYDRAREAALELVIRNPMEWRPRVTLIDVLSASGMEERRDREIEAILREHRNDEQAMVALAQICAEYGNVRAATRLYEIALENGYALSIFSLTLAEAYVQNGQFQKAIELCNELIREDPNWMVSTEGSFNAIRSLAYFGSGDPELGRLYLKNFLDSQRSNVSQLFQAARRFREFGLYEQALRVLKEAHEREPRNEQVLATLVDVEMRQGEFFSLNEHLTTLFDLRRPDYTLLEDIYLRLQSDRFLFTDNRTVLLETLKTILDEQEGMNWEIWQRRPAETS